MSIAAQVVGLQEGANKGRLPNVPDGGDVASPAVDAEILPLGHCPLLVAARESTSAGGRRQRDFALPALSSRHGPTDLDERARAGRESARAVRVRFNQRNDKAMKGLGEPQG